MTKEKDHEELFEDYLVVGDWNFDNINLGIEKLPEEFIEKIPGNFFFDVPYITSKGEVEVKTVIYLFPRDITMEAPGDEEMYNFLLIPDTKIRLMVFKEK